MERSAYKRKLKVEMLKRGETKNERGGRGGTNRSDYR